MLKMDPDANEVSGAIDEMKLEFPVLSQEVTNMGVEIEPNEEIIKEILEEEDRKEGIAAKLTRVILGKRKDEFNRELKAKMMYKRDEEIKRLHDTMKDENTPMIYKLQLLITISANKTNEKYINVTEFSRRYHRKTEFIAKVYLKHITEFLSKLGHDQPAEWLKTQFDPPSRNTDYMLGASLGLFDEFDDFADTALG